MRNSYHKIKTKPIFENVYIYSPVLAHACTSKYFQILYEIIEKKLLKFSIMDS